LSNQQHADMSKQLQKKYWICASCTLSNPYTSDVCDACAKQRVDIVVTSDDSPFRVSQNEAFDLAFDLFDVLAGTSQKQ
jgi:hypothetical protein